MDELKSEINSEVVEYVNNILNILDKIGDTEIDLNEIDNYLKDSVFVNKLYTKEDFGSDWLEIPYLLLENQDNTIKRQWSSLLNGLLQKFNNTLLNVDLGSLILKYTEAKKVNYDVSNETDVVNTIKFQMTKYNYLINNELKTNSSNMKITNSLILYAQEFKILDDDLKWINLNENDFSKLKDNLYEIIQNKKNTVEKYIKQLDDILETKSIENYKIYSRFI